MSIVSDAIETWRECRADFEDYRLAEYDRVEEATRGTLPNRRGKRAHVDALSLFMGNAARAHAYASDELIEWWQSNPRPTYESFERQWVAARQSERGW